MGIRSGSLATVTPLSALPPRKVDGDIFDDAVDLLLVEIIAYHFTFKPDKKYHYRKQCGIDRHTDAKSIQSFKFRILLSIWAHDEDRRTCFDPVRCHCYFMLFQLMQSYFDGGQGSRIRPCSRKCRARKYNSNSIRFEEISKEDILKSLLTQLATQDSKTKREYEISQRTRTDLSFSSKLVHTFKNVVHFQIEFGHLFCLAPAEEQNKKAAAEPNKKSTNLKQENCAT